MAKNKTPGSPAPYRYQGTISTRLAELSAAEQAVATHLAAHPDELPFETAASLAKRLRVSPMTVGRTLKALGYQGLADIRAEMRAEVSDAPPWTRREDSVTAPPLKSLDRARALRAEVQAIQAVHQMADTPLWSEIVGTIAAADQVFVAGFQTERGVALSFADQLAYVRRGVRLIAVEDRGFADLKTEVLGVSCLVMIDCRRYSRSFRLLGETAVTLGMPLVIVTDSYCTWAAMLSRFTLQARTDSGRFWDNNAPLLSLLNILVEDVIERLGDAVYAQLDATTEFRAKFVGFDRARGQREGRDFHPRRAASGSGPRGSKATRVRQAHEESRR